MSFGFPLQYSTLSEYYDLLSQGNETVHIAIERAFREHGVKSVIDFTCGTGAQVFWLAKRGFTVTGNDLSEDLLAIAREKAKAESLDVTFVQGDMRSKQIGKFDAAISIFNAIGHLSKDEFLQAMKNIRNNLKPGGLYIFDIFNLDAMSDTMVEDLSMDLHESAGDVTIHHVQKSKLHRESGILTSYDEFEIDKGENFPTVLHEQFSLQIYSAKQLKDLLEKAGFVTLDQYALDGSPFHKSSSESILTVAQVRS